MTSRGSDGGPADLPPKPASGGAINFLRNLARSRSKSPSSTSTRRVNVQIPPKEKSGTLPAKSTVKESTTAIAPQKPLGVFARLSMRKKNEVAPSSKSRRASNDSRQGMKTSGSKSSGIVDSDVSIPGEDGNGMTPRLALLSMSENDLRSRHITRDRGSDPIGVPPLVSSTVQFMSQDNLASAECGAVPYRTPSYLRISKALNGYTRTPRAAEDSPLREMMGQSLVERRLQQFGKPRENKNARNDLDDSYCASTPQRHGYPKSKQFTAVASSSESGEQLAMGNQISTPPAIKSLISRFDSLNLCSDEKSLDTTSSSEDNKENKKQPIIVAQPISSSDLGEKSEKKVPVTEAATPAELSVPELASVEPEIAAAVVESSAAVDGVDGTASAEVTEEVVVASAPAVVSAPPPAAAEPKIIHVRPMQPAVVEEPSSAPPPARSGKFFEQLLEDTRGELSAKATAGEKELEEVADLPEAAADALRSYCGSVRLLIRKKLSKFEELVKKNLNPIEGDPQPAKIEDLEGYWGLVEIELDDLKKRFDVVETWRRSNWSLTEFESSSSSSAGGSGRSSPSSPPAAERNNNNIVKKATRASGIPKPTVPRKKTEAELEAAKKAKAEKMAAMAEFRRKRLQEEEAERQRKEAEDAVAPDTAPRVEGLDVL